MIADFLLICLLIVATNSIEEEVRSVFHNSQSSSTTSSVNRGLNILNSLSLNTSRSSNVSLTNRRRPGKYKASQRKATTSPKVKIEQRHLVCLNTEDNWKDVAQFTQDLILFDGLLRFSSELNEDEMFDIIVSELKTCDKLKDVQKQDLEYVKVSNKQIRHLDGKITFDARAVVGLYKTGAIYLQAKMFKKPAVSYCYTSYLKNNKVNISNCQ